MVYAMCMHCILKFEPRVFFYNTENKKININKLIFFDCVMCSRIELKFIIASLSFEFLLSLPTSFRNILYMN
jgi:hypothetical protein